MAEDNIRGKPDVDCYYTQRLFFQTNLRVQRVFTVEQRCNRMQWKELVKCSAEIEDYGRGERKVEIEPCESKVYL